MKKKNENSNQNGIYWDARKQRERERDACRGREGWMKREGWMWKREEGDEKEEKEREYGK